VRNAKQLNSEAGFTVLEAAVSLSVLAVALCALWGTLVYCSRANRASEEKKQALNAAQAMVEDLKSADFDTLIAEFGPGGNVGNRFGVPTLDDDLSVAQGEISFYTDETNVVGDLQMGFPLDLNGDGDNADLDVSTGYQLLPVLVTIRWRGSIGDQRVDLRSILRKEE